MRKSFKFRVYPSKKQAHALDRALDACRCKVDPVVKTVQTLNFRGSLPPFLVICLSSCVRPDLDGRNLQALSLVTTDALTKVNTGRRQIVQRLMGALMVVEVQISRDPFSAMSRRVILVQIHLLIFQASPQSFNKDVVECPTFAVHADSHVMVL